MKRHRLAANFEAVRTIDCHVHLYPPEVNADPARWARGQGETLWERMCARTRSDGRPVQSFPSVDELIRKMDEGGIARSVLLGWYWERGTACVRQNRYLAECVQAYPDRLSAFATVQPLDGDVAITEMLRCRDEGLIGLGELSPHSQGVDCRDSRLAALFDAAAECRFPVNLHVTDPASRRYPGRVETPWDDFRHLAAAHPKTNFILAHWAGGMDVRGLANVWVDTAASPLIYGTGFWDRVGAKVESERVLFGSDFPLNLYPGTHMTPEMHDFPASIGASTLGAAEQAAILRENAMRLLRLA